LVGGVQVIGIKVGARLGCYSVTSCPVASKPFSVSY